MVVSKCSELLAFHQWRVHCFIDYHLQSYDKSWTLATRIYRIYNSRRPNVRLELLFPHNINQENVESSLHHSWSGGYRVLVHNAPECTALRPNHSSDALLVKLSAHDGSTYNCRSVYWRLVWKTAGLHALHVTSWSFIDCQLGLILLSMGFLLRQS